MISRLVTGYWILGDQLIRIDIWTLFDIGILSFGIEMANRS